MVSTDRAPYINYHEALNKPVKGENYSEVPLFIGKGSGSGSTSTIYSFNTYNDVKKVFNDSSDLSKTLKEFYIENNTNTDSTRRVNKCYVINIGASGTVSDYLTALKNSKVKKDTTAVIFSGINWGAYTAPTTTEEVRTAGSYANQTTIKPVLLSALDIIHEDGDVESINQMETGLLRIIYVPLPSYCDASSYSEGNAHTSVTDDALIDLMKYLRTTDSSATSYNKKVQDSRMVFVESQAILSDDKKTENNNFFGRTISKICNTPYYMEAGYEAYNSISVGLFNERSTEERDALLNAGVVFNEDDYSLPEITPRICLTVSSAWGVDSTSDVDSRVNDALVHTRRNADYQVRELLKIIAPQLKRNETSVNIAFVRTDCQLYLENEISEGHIMEFSISVEEATLNPYQLKIIGSITPVNSTLGIDFENYIGAPYAVASDYV